LRRKIEPGWRPEAEHRSGVHRMLTASPLRFGPEKISPLLPVVTSTVRIEPQFRRNWAFQFRHTNKTRRPSGDQNMLPRSAPARTTAI
jgi:hypothetical protein